MYALGEVGQSFHIDDEAKVLMSASLMKGFWELREATVRLRLT
jgi:hypothetical protein